MIPKATAYETDAEVLRNRVNALRVENEWLKVIEIAARNLVAQKGRHNTQIAYERLESALKTPRPIYGGVCAKLPYNITLPQSGGMGD